MNGSLLKDSLDTESGAKGVPSGEILGRELEDEELGDFGTGVCYPGDISGGNGYINLDGSPLG